MMFAASPRFFDTIGGCDETFTGTGMDDQDWGMRVLMAGKKNMTSRNALVGHIAGFTFGAPGQQRPDNRPIFQAKWGQAIDDEWMSGALWDRLRGTRLPDVETKRTITW
jgi:GT2 family glycosyltransferase